MSTRRWAFGLAIGATSTALCLSVLAGWQRGGSLPERLVWVAIGLVLVTSAHLLPALLRDAPLLVRSIGSVLWGACLATACFGHAVFFVCAQQHAGELRASSVQRSPVPTSGRRLADIMAERATVTAQLASANARYCVGNCATLDGRRVTLSARLDALNAEADETRRDQAERDRVTAQRETLLADPVTSRLAALLSTTTARVDLLSGLMFAAVLEGVACLLWAIALRSPSPTPLPVTTGLTPSAITVVTETADATPSAVAEVASVTSATECAVSPTRASHADETVSRKMVSKHDDDTARTDAPQDDPITPQRNIAPTDDHLSRLVRDVEVGLVRPTVADIRRHLGCSQARAAALRRQLAERHATA